MSNIINDPQRIFKKAVIKGQKFIKNQAKRFFSITKEDIKFKNIDEPIVALDIMGGDFAPVETIKGAIRAAKELGIRVQMVGHENIIKKELRNYNIENLPLEIIHCEDYIKMDEKHPANAVKRQKNSSIVVSMRQVAEGKAHAAVSAGSTGAAAAAALFALKRISGIERPAIALQIPTIKGNIVLIDAGANVDSTPFQIAQHAIMGSVYAENILNIKNPRVGLLSIGEEPGKGNKATKDIFEVLQTIKSINFIGNVEGRVIANCESDVVVCDGFVGNVFLKTVEGTAKMIFHHLSEELKNSNLDVKLGALMCKPAFRNVRNNLNPAKTGGALLLGVGGVAIIAHGNSNDFAIMNAIKIGAESAKSNLVSKIQNQISLNEIELI